ncbi:MAG TPA: tripartite tricarboxylate transporter substrate binding protein [Syntrophorhabdales bacterium]|nr:tripartite tricarboxylate transporter substrate binding protein [Syntrophorhabdales bacterium]
MRRPSLLIVTIAVASLLCVPWPINAQTYPAHPIQLIVPMAPGDTVDLAGRAIATELAKILKNPVIVNNKPGGGSTVGADFVVKGKKDGYTLLFANSNIYYAHAMNPADVPYNPLTDLDPLCLAVSTPLTVAVNTDAPWKTFQELVTYMKSNPGKVRASSTGVGGVGHFNLEVIMNETGAQINMIPYKGASPAMTALMGGHVEMSVLSLSLIHPQLQAGKLRALLISKKTPEFPNIPTMKQLGYKNDMSSVLFAFYAPMGTPESVKKTLASPLEKAIKAPEVVKAMEQLGAVEDYVPGPEYKKMMTSEYEMVKKLLKGAGSAAATK